MGKDKAFLELAGRPLITHAIEIARAITTQIVIVGDPAKFARFGEVVPDVYPSRGPLGGIHAALVSSKSDLNLILGVDLPFVQPGFLRFLILTAQNTDAVVTLPSSGGHLQTLCAVYRRRFSSVAEHALRNERNKIDALFDEVPVRVIEEQELLSAGFPLSMFSNLNTPGEWDRAVREFERPPHHLL